VAAGIWTHAQAVDGSFTFADLMDAHELLAVKAKREAQWRAYWKDKEGDK
jgi:hypothetical protein